MTDVIGLRLRMLSDWHIGTGGGVHGHLDRRVQRDQDGLPYVPAKTLAGVWRDACEVAAHALDSGPAGVWHDWVDDLFGTQHHTTGPGRGTSRPARLAVGGALRMPGRMGEALRGRPQLRQAAAFLKVGVAIDPATGTAADEELRVEEMARAGVCLTGSAELGTSPPLGAEQRRAAAALLWAGARLVERIGANRRRGAGRCRLELDGALFPADLDILASASPPAPPPHRYGDVAADPVPASGPGWERATLLLRTRTPVLVPAQTQGNLVSGRDHLPGGALFPAVLRCLGGRAAALARRGDLVVTAAAPGPPVPRVYLAKKGDPSVLLANALADEPDGSGKPAGRGFLDAGAEGDGDGDAPPRVVLPETVVRMHNTIRDDVQRPTQDIGGVYIYEALAPGQEFRAEVRVRAGVLTSGWAGKLAGTWRVGASSKDDYGLVDVTLAGAGPLDTSGGTRPGLSEGEELVVWAQSDVLVRDRRLRPSADAADVGRALERALAAAGARGVRLAPLRDGRTSLALSRVDSWHRTWQLPRPTLLGVAGGSCLLFRVTQGSVPPRALAEVECGGIGERTAEGFGQVLLNDPRLRRRLATSAVPRQEPPGQAPAAERAAGETAPLAPGETGYEEARVIERAAWREAMRRAAEELAADRRRRERIVPTQPTLTQLNAVRRLFPALDDEAVTTWLDSLAWPEEAIARLRRLLTERHTVWDHLKLPEAELTATRDGRETLRAELATEAIRVLLETCLREHARESGDGDGLANGKEKRG